MSQLYTFRVYGSIVRSDKFRQAAYGIPSCLPLRGGVRSGGVRRVYAEGVTARLSVHTRLRPGTHYPHVTWAHAMLRVQLGYLTLNSAANSHFCQLCLLHVIWRGTLVGLRASTPLKVLLSHTFRETWRTCQVLFNIVKKCFQKWSKCLLKKLANGPFYTTQVTRL
jgi:hypothetical protein